MHNTAASLPKRNNPPGPQVFDINRSHKDWFPPNTLDFLGDGEYTMELFTDAEDTDTDPNHLEKKVLQVKKTDTIEVHLGASGGAAAIIKP